ncbi:MAG: hypothetical protein WA798_04810, partial [Candidatus Acidiferrum sp.]
MSLAVKTLGHMRDDIWRHCVRFTHFNPSFFQYELRAKAGRHFATLRRSFDLLEGEVEWMEGVG